MQSQHFLPGLAAVWGLLMGMRQKTLCRVMNRPACIEMTCTQHQKDLLLNGRHLHKRQTGEHVTPIDICYLHGISSANFHLKRAASLFSLA
jgi:hypothetical protein